MSFSGRKVMSSHLNCEHFVRVRGAVFCPTSSTPLGALTSRQVAVSRLLTNWLLAKGCQCHLPLEQPRPSVPPGQSHLGDPASICNAGKYVLSVASPPSPHLPHTQNRDRRSTVGYVWWSEGILDDFQRVDHTRRGKQVSVDPPQKA